MDDIFLKKLSQGVDIGGYTTLPCQVQKKGGNTFSIVLTEGKNRQIRRMCDALGATVKNLHRVRIMNVKIGNLKIGQWENIPQPLLEELFQSVNRADLSKTSEELAESEE